MVDAGQISLIIAIMVSTYVALVSFLGRSLNIPELITSARYAFYTLPLLLLMSTLALVYAFVTNDFSVRYVAENSNLAMPHAYTWVALYAGNAGSLLFLALVFSLLAILVVVSMKKRLPSVTPYSTGLMAIILTFFIGIMIFLANPLERLDVVPLDGQGINPLLVHFGMFIHPPIQMTGLISVSIPFCIAIGVLIDNRGGLDDWVDIGRVWAMVTWITLTIGLLLGSWWAYTILGWGGYWAWDPVENSALMPWLVLTAFVHSIMVQKRRGMFRMWNMILIIIAFTLAQLGMFINRGGPVPSVHSFGQSTMGWLFLVFMGFTLIGSMGVFLWRMDGLTSKTKLESVLSREGVFLIQNIIFLLVAFVTLWGTIFPVFSEAAKDTSMTVGEPFFNLVNGPLLLSLVFLMGIGPLLPWRNSSISNLITLLRYPVGAAITMTVILLVLGLRQLPPIIAFATCSIVITGIVQEWIIGTRSRHNRGVNYPLAFCKLIMSNRSKYGGYVVHIAIIMLAVGATASSFYSIEKDISMEPGEEFTIQHYTLKYVRVVSNSFSDRQEEIAEFQIFSDGKDLGTLKANRTYYPEFRIASTRGAIRSTPMEDLYIVPSQFDQNGRGIFRVMINPMVWWMWASGPIFVLGVLLAIGPRFYKRPRGDDNTLEERFD